MGSHKLFRSALVLSFVLSFSAIGLSQETGLAAGAKSLSFALPSSSNPMVGLSYFLSEGDALRIDFSCDVMLTDGGNAMGFVLMPSYVTYLTTDRLSTYLKGSFILTKKAGIEFGKGTDVGLGGYFGVEFFFTPEFSMAGEVGGTFDLINEFETMTLGSGTGTLFANLYF